VRRDHKQDQLLTEALLNPEITRTRMIKATQANVPFIQRGLATHLNTVAAPVLAD
jgi:hypothetical protein